MQVCRRFRVGDESLYCSLASKKANMYVNKELYLRQVQGGINESHNVLK